MYSPVRALLVAATLCATLASAQEARRGRAPMEHLAAHWFDDDARFWYKKDLPGGAREFVLVEAATGTRGPAFDHTRLAAALTKAGMPCRADRLPFDEIDFARNRDSIRFRADGKVWVCDLATYICRVVGAVQSSATPAPAAVDLALLEGPWPEGAAETPELLAQAPPRRAELAAEVRSPDGKRTALVREGNVRLRGPDGKEEALTKDGTAERGYGLLSWSPDGLALAAWRITPGERKEVYLLESSPKAGYRALLHPRPYPQPGDRFTAYELHLFDAANSREVSVRCDPSDFGTPRPRWRKEGHVFTYEKVDRGHQRFRLIEVDALAGTTRNLIDERSETFVATHYAHGLYLRHLEGSNEILFGSERDGWRHLYLLDGRTGAVKHQVTRGPWMVRGVERLDETARQVWFRASGAHPTQDPYHVHHYRVNFDGSGLVALTEGDGTHTLDFSPSRNYYVDSYSRVDLPPIHELRRATDGKYVCHLEQADVSELRSAGWEAPEVFVAKGRDGVTDIWGIICRPKNFDPARKYPVIESIYAGPHGAFVPKTFAAFRRHATLTDLGFIVVQIDGMGTAFRSKAFHDVCWKNLKDAGFPDRIRWHRAAAAKYRYYDATRVGIYGTSAGGQSAAGALLFHGDFYRAAFAACGCHDNRIDKASWNEQWMGYPVGPHYAACSNLDHAHRLTGKLMLLVGEMDTNVPPESTLRFADALIKAGKDFDLVVMPGVGHSDGGRYGARRMADFFVRHLQGAEPPDRNRPSSP